MTVLPNDDFDMCCGNRPLVTVSYPWVDVKCGICGMNMQSKHRKKWELMIRWNKAQREKAGEGEA